MTQESSFWCLKLNPGNAYKIDLPLYTELKLTNACIVPQTPPVQSSSVSFMELPPLRPPLPITRLYINPNADYNDDSELVLLATFITGRIEHQTFQYTMRSDQDKSSWHIMNSGSSGEVIHICGTISSFENKNDSEEDEEDDNRNESNYSTSNQNHTSYGNDDDDDNVGFHFGGQNTFGAFGL